MSNLNVETINSSTINTSTITNGTESISVSNNYKGTCRAWCNYNGVLNTIRSSYNVTSVTDEATGQFRINFTTAMPNDDYVLVSSAVANDQAVRQIGVGVQSNKLTTSCGVKSVYCSPFASGYFDYEVCDVAFFSE